MGYALLGQNLRSNAVQNGEIKIEQHFLAAQQIDRLCDSRGGNDLLAHSGNLQANRRAI